MNQIWKIIIAIVITAVIVGGGVYAWQNSILRSTEQPFQEQIDASQNQIVNIQEPTQPVADIAEKTQESTQSTDEIATWQTYENKEIGLSFRYPASYGDFQISINNGETGKNFIGNFENNKYFSIGGITADYTAPRSGYFLDFVKYLYEGGKYYHLTALNQKWLLAPIKIISADNQEILIINDDSYVEEKNVEGPAINPGPNGGALINFLGAGEFKGVAVWNSDIKTLQQSNFEEILKTFKFTR